MFSEEDLDLFASEFGKDIPVQLVGVQIAVFKGIDRYEEVIQSVDETEIGSSILTLQIKKSDYLTLGKGSKYTFVVDSVSYIQRGPHELDGSGFVKIKLTQART